ncbi:hypothetical protein COCNU_09G009290 [Cocos nucifera]|uniref:Small acidic protein 1 n=1 Tax=Cocos nucifera TaxID=13894 RepID=A0A8K0IL76_COCNU|nr:hypothetical protein COCNU_09G009290 [Cocos nucifera]
MQTLAGAGTGVFLCQQQEQQEQETMEEAAVVGGVGMEVDDADPIDVLPEFDKHLPPVDADFFNSFDDDFDDQDLA